MPDAPRRTMMQIRPKGVPGAPSYSPQRDLVNLYPHALREAIMGLDKVHWQDYFAGWMEATNTTQDDLGEGVRLFVEAQHLFVGDPTITQPVEAFEKVGFFLLPHPVRIMLYQRLGEVMAAGFFVALRDVTLAGDVPPNEADIAAYVAAGRVMAAQVTGGNLYGDLEKLNLELATRMEAAIVEREDLRHVISRLKHDRADLQEKLANLTSDYAHVVKVREQYTRRGLWQTLRDWWAWRRHRMTPTSTTN